MRMPVTADLFGSRLRRNFILLFFFYYDPNISQISQKPQSDLGKILIWFDSD